ncbi:MAG: aminoglycoside 3-N-acetyltransferase [Pyrinomonadaceae bacterium]
MGDLKNIGIRVGDIIMVHASLRAVGEVEGRGEGLVRSLLSVLGESGTLLAYVDFEPTDEVPYFDPERSPARPGYGTLAEIIRRWPGAVRSLNPGASMVAVGARAEWICRDHPLNYGYGAGTPLAKLAESGGKVLLLGSDFNNVTILHYAESIADIPDKRVIKRTDKVLSGGEVIDLIVEEFDTGNPVISAMPEDYFAEITREFVNLGRAQVGLVGSARSVLLPAGKFVSFAVSKMEREFGF